MISIIQQSGCFLVERKYFFGLYVADIIAFCRKRQQIEEKIYLGKEKIAIMN